MTFQPLTAPGAGDDGATLMGRGRGVRRATASTAPRSTTSPQRRASPRAVYSNFAGKDDLFLAVFEDRYSREQDEMQRVLTEEGQPWELGGETRCSSVRVSSTARGTTRTALYLEFVLYAQRNADARKLSAVVRRQRR